MKVVEFGNVSMRGNDLIISHFVFAHENDEVTVSQDHSVVAMVEAICAFIKEKCPPVHESRIYSPPGFLASCPFCGSSAIAGRAGNGGHYVECLKCDANVGALMGSFSGEDGANFKTQEAAISAWNTRHIAPPVAAGSVDTGNLTMWLKALYHAADGHQLNERLGTALYHINLYAEQAREAGKQDALDLTVSVGQLRQRAENAEARVKELEEQAAARLPFKIEPQGIVGNGPNAKEGDRPCWTPDCGTF